MRLATLVAGGVGNCKCCYERSGGGDGRDIGDGTAADALLDERKHEQERAEAEAEEGARPAVSVAPAPEAGETLSRRFISASNYEE